MFLEIAIVVLGLMGMAVLASRRSRGRLLARIRVDWGTPGQRSRDIAAITAACRSRLATLDRRSTLDDRTWADLNLDQVFAAIDRTGSTLGQQALYHRLRTAPLSENLDTFSALVDRMTADVAARERAQLALSRLQDPHGYDVWWLARPNAVESRPWYVLFPLLTVVTVAVALLALHWHVLLPWLVALLVGDFGVRFSAANRVCALGGAFWQVAPIVATGEELAFLNGPEIAAITGTMASDAARLHRLKTVARWLSGDPFMKSFSSDGLAMIATPLVQTVYEYVNLFLLLDANGVYFGARDVRAHGGALVRLASAIGDVDAAISVASWRAERGDWTRPRFVTAGSAAVLSDLRHPLVDDAVPNSIVLEPGRGILITGSNMSGKSTFLRTVGVGVVLAQTIDTCLATAYEAPVFRVQSCIGRADNLIAGKSYYAVEVEEVLSRVQAGAREEQHLFLFDELFRGTNAVERIAAAEAVISELVRQPGIPRSHVVLVATHDAELVDLLCDSCSAWHFADTIGPEGLVFDYRLEAGPATTRNAITLLELGGAPPSLVRRALDRAAALDRERGS